MTPNSLVARLRKALGMVVVSVLAVPAAASAQTEMQKVPIYTYVALDEFEWRATGPEEALEFDGQAWVGGDFHRLWLKASGERASGEGAEGDFEIQALYSRATSAFWNFQAGLRFDRQYGEEPSQSRGFLAVGFEGLAPYWFEVESFVFLSQDGDLSARLEASYDMLVTQRLILESAFELNVAAQSTRDFGIGAGIGDLELAARVRYEFKREFAPYVGYSWNRLFGETADLAQASASPASGGALVLGLHLWY